ITAAFSRALSPEMVAEVAASHTLAFGARGGYVAHLTESGKTLEILNHTDSERSRGPGSSRIPIDSPHPLAAAARSGTPSIFADQPMVDSGDGGAGVAAPLTIDNGTIGAIGLLFDSAQPWTAADHDFFLAIAAQCAQAMERARLYDLEA